MSEFTILGIPFTLPVSAQVDILTSISIIVGSAAFTLQQFSAKRNAVKKEKFELVKQIIEKTSKLLWAGKKNLTAFMSEKDSPESEKFKKAKTDFENFQWEIEELYVTTTTSLLALKDEEGVSNMIKEIRDQRNKITAGGGINGVEYDLLLDKMQKELLVKLGVVLYKLI